MTKNAASNLTKMDLSKANLNGILGRKKSKDSIACADDRDAHIKDLRQTKEGNLALSKRDMCIVFILLFSHRSLGPGV